MSGAVSEASKTSAEAAQASGAQILSRGLTLGAVLGLARLALIWMPASSEELWPVRLADLGSAPAALLCVLATSTLAAYLASRRSLVGCVLAFVALWIGLSGWPVIEVELRPVEWLRREPMHAGAALLSALAATFWLARTRQSLSMGVAALAPAVVLAGAFYVSLQTGKDLPKLHGERVLFNLITDEEARTVIRENPDFPVRTSSFAAHTVTQFDSGNLPVLELTPPAQVRLSVPAGGPGAVLRFSAGIAADSYTSEQKTRVELEATLDGKPVLQAGLSTWSKTAAKKRVWHRAEVEVPTGGELVLTSSYNGRGEPPTAGFGLLEVSVPVRGHRTLATPHEPNVILILIDTLRADRLSIYGNAQESSPGIDALARNGVVFDRAYSSASWTWPSTASVLTSLLPPEHGVLNNTACYLSDALLTVPEVFQDAGFTTAGFVSNPLVSADKNFDQGFEFFKGYRWEPAVPVLADASEWLGRMGRYRFFLYLHLVDPHAPYEPEQVDLERFGSPEPEDFSAEAQKQMVDAIRLGNEYDHQRLGRFSEYLSNLYDGEVATADRAIGALLTQLERMGLADRTIVAVTSDHGEEFLEHGMLGHGRQLFDESVRVPLILSGPGIARGERTETRVENRFLGPSLLRLAGVEARENLKGRPFLLDPEELQLLESQPTYLGSELGWWPGHGQAPLYGVQQDNWFYVWSPSLAAAAAEAAESGEGEAGQEQMFHSLFDLNLDPEAKRDVASEHPEVARRLAQMITDFLDASKAVRPTVFDGGSAVSEELKGLGYLASDEEDEEEPK